MNNKSYMESYTDAEFELYWGDDEQPIVAKIATDWFCDRCRHVIKRGALMYYGERDGIYCSKKCFRGS